MSKRGRPKKTYPLFEDLPESFRGAMIKMMAHFDISDIGEGFDRAATLLNIRSRAFEKEVQREAERRYRVRHFTEQNKTVSTVKKNAFNNGFSQGIKEGKDENRVWFYCKKCEKPIDITPNSNVHMAVIRLLKKEGWTHVECP